MHGLPAVRQIMQGSTGQERKQSMREELVRLFENARVPRYTSYPTAPHFSGDVGAEDYGQWLEELDARHRVSLYFHVPFCHQLCWYCGCNTTVTHNRERIIDYTDRMARELDLLEARLHSRLKLTHLHWGGGTPTTAGAEGILSLMTRAREIFDFDNDAEIAIEIDPRSFSADDIGMLAQSGFNRVSIGVQTFDSTVQQAINRMQDFACVKTAVDGLRSAGIGRISMDLLYGLPHQTVDTLERTVSRVLEFRPDRIALFGYAHLPARIRHQRMIDESALADPTGRAAQYEAVGDMLSRAGYVAIGLDHFALPGDSMAIAARNGTLHRNFQGYTTDAADALIGVGASSIGSLPQGYVQNHVRTDDYRQSIEAGRLPVARGLRLDAQMRLDRAIIERIMCDGAVDLRQLAEGSGLPDHAAEPNAAVMGRLHELGIVRREGTRLEVTRECRPLLRLVAASFDRFLDPSGDRHAAAI